MPPANIRKSSRITPAYAGKSGFFLLDQCVIEDHPRMCGEKPDSRNTLQLSPGSPPRMRGKDSAPQVYHRQGGITPAYAGKRGKGNEQSNGNGDHPRVCGEKRRAACFAISAAGSPPRMRGKGCLSGRPLLTAGITPAYAGKSNVA